MTKRWRTGRNVGRTIYNYDELVGVMDTPDLARMVVDAMNLIDNIPEVTLPLLDQREHQERPYCGNDGSSMFIVSPQPNRRRVDLGRAGRK